ncbi:hypothetical protein [Nocardia brasiliensis]|uniref:hypothetical protein n=1 Tax=Nocardia brasiliensis TaxID=37326 RepID=UPI002456A6E8|nr:hypothetical protein [Nocardia brasiliensis]
MAETTELEMVEGGLYRNTLGAELRLVHPACYDGTLTRSFELLAPGLWIAEQRSILGTRAWLVTAEGLRECGYVLVSKEPADGQ